MEKERVKRKGISPLKTLQVLGVLQSCIWSTRAGQQGKGIR